MKGNIAEKEITLMRMIGRGLTAAAGVCTLLEGHVARTVHLLRFSNRTGCKQTGTQTRFQTTQEVVPKRHKLYCMFVFSRTLNWF